MEVITIVLNSKGRTAKPRKPREPKVYTSKPDRKAYEFVCSSCFLVKNVYTQLAKGCSTPTCTDCSTTEG